MTLLQLFHCFQKLFCLLRTGLLCGDKTQNMIIGSAESERERRKRPGLSGSGEKGSPVDLVLFKRSSGLLIFHIQIL